MHQFTFRSLLIVALLTCQGSFAVADDAPEEVWQVFRLSGQRIGYGRTTEHTIEEDGRSLLVTESVQTLSIKRFGQVLVMETEQSFVETEDGLLVRFGYVMDNPPNSHSETVGVVEGDQIRVTTTVLGESSEVILEDMEGVRSPIALDRSLEDDPLEKGETRSELVFFPEFNQSVELTVTAEDNEQITLYDGSMVEAMRISMPNPLLPGVNVDSFFVEDKGLLLSKTSLLDMEVEVVPADVALAEVEGADLDIVVQSLVHVEGLENPHAAGRIVYRITTNSGRAADGFVPDGTQEINEVDEHTIELTVRRAAMDAEGDTTNVPADEFLAASSFLDCEDEEIRRLAIEGAGELESHTEIAIAMEKFVHDRLTAKNFSTGLARASEVARTLAGDCTEHAVLLAAMLRVKHIPSRVCVGLVYADSLAAFGGHMWTEAWLNGQWIPLDATLGAGGIGAGHLKLAHSSLSEDAPSPLSLFGPVVLMTGQLEIEVIEVEH